MRVKESLPSMPDVRFYTRENADQIVWPETADGDYARRYLLPFLSDGPQAYIRNVHNTELIAAQVGETILPLTLSSFWGRFGWMNVLMEPNAVLVLDGIGIVGLIAAAFFLWKHWPSLLFGQRLAVILLLLGFLFVSLLFVVFNLTTVQPQGRYFFPALATIGIFVALGWVRLAGRWRSWAVWLLLAGMVGVNLLVLVRTILPAYAS